MLIIDFRPGVSIHNYFDLFCASGGCRKWKDAEQSQQPGQAILHVLSVVHVYLFRG
jgi:hypothetical protein